MNTNENKMLPDDEIDFGRFFRRSSKIIMHPIWLLMSHYLITICFILAGIGFAVLFKYLTPKTYSGTFVMRPTDIKDKLYLKVLNDIPALMTAGDKKATAKLLGLDSNLFADVVKITVFPPTFKNPTDSSNAVDIEIIAKQPSVILPVQNAILGYMVSNPYYTTIRQLHTEQISFNLREIEDDLKRLDSLKALQLASYGKNQNGIAGNVLVSDLINPASLYTASAERAIKKTSFLAQKTFLDRFLLIKSCVVPTHPSWPPRILVLCVFTVPAFLLLCVIFLYTRRR